MQNSKQILKYLKHGLHVPVGSENGISMVISPFKDSNGNYRGSFWEYSLEKAKQNIGATFHGEAYIESNSKDWKILTPYRFTYPPLKVGDKVQILDSIKKTRDWDEYKNIFPNMKGTIKEACNDIDGLYYVVREKGDQTLISEKYLAPYFPTKKTTKKTMVGKKLEVKIDGKVYEGEIKGEK